MKNLLPKLFFAVIFLSFLWFSPQPIFAQTATPETQTTADENYELNISESRATEADYSRSTQVKVNGTGKQAGVSVGVGAAVRAEKISITLRGVTGSVRFRASLESLRRIEKLKTNQTPPVSAPNP